MKTLKSASWGSNSWRSLRSWLEKPNQAVNDESFEPRVIRKTYRPALVTSPSIGTLTAAQCPLSAESPTCRTTGVFCHPAGPPGNQSMDGWMDGVKLEGCILIWCSPPSLLGGGGGCNNQSGGSDSGQLLEERSPSDRWPRGGGGKPENLKTYWITFTVHKPKVWISWMHLQPSQPRETLNYSHFPISE